MKMSTSPAPKSPEQTDKSRKYDRQLRLWGDHGQLMLENANVCLVNATAVGCELLKGLVLPGVGGFTIADGSIVTEEDLGANFFLNSASIGKSKAVACMQLLQELNPDVRGNCVEESVEYLLANRTQFFEEFSIVVASNLCEKTLLQLSNCLWAAQVPFIYCRSLGFYGSIRLQIKEHCVVEAHPDNPFHDLRLAQPFPALREHLEQTAITSKVPWLLVLSKYQREWSAQHEGRLPKTYQEKSELKALIRAHMQKDEENYEEAIKAVNTAFVLDGSVTPALQNIFDDADCNNLSQKSSPFWIMVRALKEFVRNENNHLLPVSGALPDMTADTVPYISLQNIYRTQAMQDANVVYRKCQTLLKDLGLPDDTVLERDVRLLCRESAGLTVIRGSKIAEENIKDSQLWPVMEDMDVQGGTWMEIYVALRAYEKFLSDCGNIPGECFVENDTSKLKTIASKMLAELGSGANISDDMIHEICRYGGAEIHTVSAFIGGCAAQEVVKIITKQYLPLDNTFLYNAITTESTSIKL